MGLETPHYNYYYFLWPPSTKPVTMSIIENILTRVTMSPERSTLHSQSNQCIQDVYAEMAIYTTEPNQISSEVDL